MGVEYRAFLLPRPATFRPSADQLAALVGALVADRWIQGTGEVLTEQFGEGEPMPDKPPAAWFATLPPECMLRWRIEDFDGEALRYPFAIDPQDDVYYDVELALSDDFVYRTSESIDPFDRTQCACGAELSHDVDDDELFYGARIAPVCPSCGAAVDLAWPAEVRDPFTSEPRVVPGGATSRFAVVIDCGKALPSRKKRIPLAAALVATCSRALGVELHEIDEVY